MRSEQSTLETKLNVVTEGNQTVNLDFPGVPGRVSAKLLHEINDYAVRAYYEPHRWHLGASLIGHECSRYLWYTFRWCGREVGKGKNDEERTNELGRRLRLFNRGHREEERFIEFLRGVGCEVWTHDESQPRDENGEFPQYRVSSINGHFGGSIDGVIKFPPRYLIDEPVLGEFKTNGTGANFTKLKEVGVGVGKTQHFIQMSTYGRKLGLRYGAYFNVNKNDDDLHVEVTRLNWQLAEQMEHKAERIILATDPPPRMSETPTYFKCVGCAMKSVCHEGALPERNCRSCAHSMPAENAEWYCRVHAGNIPREFVPQGCTSYKAITNA